MAKANKDGWIRHRGGKCPVEKGTLVDVRFRDGYIAKKCKALTHESEDDNRSAFDWHYSNGRGDIMAWRLHKAEDEKQEETAKEAEVKETAETLRARYLATFEEKKALEVTIAARQNDIAMIEKEQEGLRGKVRALGFDFYDAPKDEEDMSDPKNWMAGDVITIKSNSNNHDFKINENVLIDGEKHEDGNLKCWHQDKRDYWWVNGKDAKFHSRPK